MISGTRTAHHGSDSDRVASLYQIMMPLLTIANMQTYVSIWKARISVNT